MTIQSAFSRALWVPPALVTPPPVASKNWNPGNYIASTTTDNDSIWDKNTGLTKTQGILQRLNTTNDPDGHWKGALLRFHWTDLENALGVYAWDDPAYPGDLTKQLGMPKVARYLAQIASLPGRRLIVFIQIKTSGSTVHAVPQYMRDSATYGDGNNYYTTRNGTVYQGSYNGEYAFESSNGGPGGFVPNMHVAAVRVRFEALMQAFADYFNDNPYLEAVCFSEAAIAEPIGSTGKASETVNSVVITRPNTDSNPTTGVGGWSDNGAWFTQMTTGFTTARAALSNVQISQWINADRADMKTFAPNIVAAGIGLGVTDLCPEEKGFNYRNDIAGQETASPGNIQHCQDAGGLTIVTGHASRPSLVGTVVGRCQETGTIQGQAHVYPDYPGLGTSRQAIRDFAVNTVGVTHLLWAHNTGNQDATGTFDAAIPASCRDTSDAYTAYGDYGGRGLNTVTDEWIHDAGSTITTVETRPTGWT